MQTINIPKHNSLSDKDTAGNHAVIKPVSDSTTAMQIQTAAGTVIGNFDTTNQRFGIGTTAPSETLDVVGTVKATALSGPLTGNVTGNCSGTAATVTGAAQTAITSLGTLTGLTVNGATVINENSADVDFRVKGNGDANLLFTDGGNDRVGIGTATPMRKLSVAGAIGVNPDLASALPAFGEGTLNGVYIQSDIDNAATAGIREEAFLTLGRYATKRVWRLSAMGNSSYGRQPDLLFGCEADDEGLVEMVRFKYDGKVGIGTTTPAELLDVNGNAKASALQINADSGTADTDDALYFGGRTTDGSGRIRYDSSTQTFYFEKRASGSWVLV